MGSVVIEKPPSNNQMLLHVKQQFTSAIMAEAHVFRRGRSHATLFALEHSDEIFNMRG